MNERSPLGLLAAAYEFYLGTPEAVASFFGWLSGQPFPAQGIVTRLNASLFAEPVQVVFIIGKAQEQPSEGTPGGHPTPVSTISGRVLLMFSLGSSQQVHVTAEFRDRRGNPADVDGVPEWMTDNSEVLDLRPTADGRSCLVRAVGPLGTARVTLTADADTGAGTTPVVGTLEVTVTAGTATVITLQPGQPEEQPTEPPAPGTT